MDIEEAKRRIKYYEDFIKLLSSYEPKTMEQWAYKLYVELESVSKVTEELNKMGYRHGNRKLVTTDITPLLSRKPTEDPMNELAHKMFKANKKRTKARWW